MRTIFMGALVLSLVSHGMAVAGEHRHETQGDTARRMAQGQKKWPTDAALRQGMEEIGRQIGQALDKKPRADEYPRMAASIEANIDGIVRDCKLTPEADEKFHPVLTRMIDGAALMKAGERPEAGMAVMVGALSDYGRDFDHPNWRPYGH